MNKKILSPPINPKMQIPEVDTCWSAIATPEQPLEVIAPAEGVLSITNLCVNERDEKVGRVLLFVKVNDGPETCVAPFTLGSFESTQIDIKLIEGAKAVFTVKGTKADIHILGYITGDLKIGRAHV